MPRGQRDPVTRGYKRVAVGFLSPAYCAEK
jgi:hypothetical protein